MQRQPDWPWPAGRGGCSIDRDDLEEQRQLFRNDLIAPVLHRDLAHGEQAAILREQAAQEWELPGGGRRRYSERTLRRLLQTRRRAGLAGLRHKRRVDAGARLRMSAEAWERAVVLRREQPRRSAEVLLLLLVHEGLISEGQCHPATLRRYLAAAGWQRKALLRERPKAYRRWQRREPAALWQFDATGGLWLPGPEGEPRQLWIIAGKDDASRLLVGGRAYRHAHQAALDDLCKRAFRRWGIPRAIYVDRGSIFVSQHFRAVCAELGVELIRATAYYPEGKGKIEAAMGLVKDSLYPELEADIAAGRITELDQVNSALEAWLNYINHRRHRATKQVPAEVYGPDPRNPYSDPLAFDELFLWRRRVTVDKFGTVPLEGNRYAVGADLRGRKVEVRYDPFDLRTVRLWVDGLFRAELAPEALVERVAAPVRSDEPTETRATGTSLLAVLRQEYEADLRRQAEDIPFRRAQAPTGPQIGALVAVLEELLVRALRPAEQRELAAAWRSRGPLLAAHAADRLRPHLARLGRHTALTAILPLLWGEMPCSPRSSD